MNNQPINPLDIKLNMQQPPPPQQQLTNFQLLCKRKEINPIVADQLFKVLSTCKIVLLCDDSSSMSQAIAEQGNDPFALKQSTRWMQLKKLASQIIQICTATNENGLDIHFLNRPSLMRVTNQQGLAQAFLNPPDGGTPLIGALRKLFIDYSQIPDQHQLLVIVITDGEPSDGSRNDLFNVLRNKNSNVHVSFAQCTDNQQDMQYLDRWDGLIPNFDNTDDYRQQLARVKAQQGPNFKFDYGDYVIKILLATFVRWYFNLDQTKVQDFRNVGQQKVVFNQNMNQNMNQNLNQIQNQNQNPYEVKNQAYVSNNNNQNYGNYDYGNLNNNNGLNNNNVGTNNNNNQGYYGQNKIGLNSLNNPDLIPTNQMNFPANYQNNRAVRRRNEAQLDNNTCCQLI